MNTLEGEGEGQVVGSGEVAEAADGKGKGEKHGDAKKKQKGKKGKDKDKDYVRSRRRGTRPEGEEAPAPENGGEPKAPRLPKRQCALLIGFCGDGYNGMQMYVSYSVGDCAYVLNASDSCQPAGPEVAHHRRSVVRCPHQGGGGIARQLG